MKANRILHFGPPTAIEYVEIDVPTPKEGEVLVRVRAAGVGPWDGWIRAGRSALIREDALPVTLGSDIAGQVAALGRGVAGFSIGDEVYGVTNPRFTGGYAEYAIADRAMLAKKPRSLSFSDAASVPVVSVTAWQMLFDHAKLVHGQQTLILGASGNVGRYAVQLAHARGIGVIASGALGDDDRLRALGAQRVLNAADGPAAFSGLQVDAVIDLVGADQQKQSLAALKKGGVLVSAVSAIDEEILRKAAVRGVFFYVNVTTSSLDEIARLIDSQELATLVGVVLKLSDARIAHEMLEGTRPTAHGKIVLSTEL